MNKKDLIKPKERLVFVKRDNAWLMNNLLSPFDHVLGCELNIPDQILLENGKPKLFLKTDPSNGCIQ